MIYGIVMFRRIFNEAKMALPPVNRKVELCQLNILIIHIDIELPHAEIPSRYRCSWLALRLPLTMEMWHSIY